MEERYCQSCGMPMGETDEMYGTEKDGSKSKEYCNYCYENGKFLSDESMEDMIESCIVHVVESNPGMTEDEAKKMMNEFFPILARWKKQ